MNLIEAVRNVKHTKAKVDRLRRDLAQANQAFGDAQKILTKSALDHRFGDDRTPDQIRLDECVVDLGPVRVEEDQAVS
jgi:hypothetical protein